MTKSRSRIALAIVLAAAAGLYAVFILRTAFRVDGRPFFTLIDDAMISMRYAQHLAAGHGLVWNIGEPPIQGFTNPGWVLLMSIFHIAGIPPDRISLAVMLTSVVILLANVVVIQRICLHVNPRAQAAPMLAAGLTAFYFPLVFWSLRGMEVGLLVLLVDLAVLAALGMKSGRTGGAMWLGLLLAVAVLVRLDAVVQATLILVYLMASPRAVRRQAYIAALIVAAAVIVILLSQRAYFGDVLPNTYYLKLTGGTVEMRLKHGVLVFLQYAVRDLMAMALVAALGLWRFRESRSSEMLLLAGLFVAQCAYSIWVGGDYAEPELDSANRFIAQGVPALIIFCALVLERTLMPLLPAGRGAGPLWVTELAVGIMLLGLMGGVPWYRWVSDNAPLLRSDIRRTRAGLAIAAHTSPDAIIAVHAAGQIPYYAERNAIDLLGLNDPVIARGPRRTSFYPGHDKWNYDYSVGERLPDLIADNWIRLADYMRQRNDYLKLGNGMYIRNDTTLVDEAGLQAAFP